MFKKIDNSTLYDYAQFKKPSVNAYHGRVFSKYLSLLAGICIICFFCYNVYQFYLLSWISASTFKVGNQDSGVVWVHAEKSSHLQHVINIFEQAGYIVITTLVPPKKWDVMWSYRFPFLDTLNDLLQRIKQHQKVNHMPGTGYLTLKVHLASLKIQWIPEAFSIPAEKEKFELEFKRDPNKLWVQKGNNHRGIKILQAKDIDYQAKNSFIQAFVEPPLLVDGKKFDVGVYVAITSVEPLLVYAYTPEILVRFCTHDYYPFNAEDTEKYVVGDDYIPISDMPSLKVYYNQYRMTARDALFTYFQSKGYDSQKIWSEVMRCIAEVLIEKQHFMQKSFTGFANKQNFFELVRMDFIIDQQANIWLMEVNMSPNLSSEAHKMNALMYEQVIYNTLSLVGIATHLKGQYSESDTTSSDRDIMFATDQCASEECHNKCPNKCRLCQHCLSDDMRMFLKKAFREHNNKGGFTRVWPPSLNASMSVNNVKTLGESNEILLQWFREKCARNTFWCV